ncbi:MAG: hypothetical protein J3K34DRAFT_446994 [Monoraphidium minutum]|nr:MAG: hypothetical protein J3K34DRAFT_446994 [Monoraphidium minutum]
MAHCRCWPAGLLLLLLLAVAGGHAALAPPWGQEARWPPGAPLAAPPLGVAGSLGDTPGGGVITAASALPPRSRIAGRGSLCFPLRPRPGEIVSFKFMAFNFGNVTSSKNLLIQLFSRAPAGVAFHYSIWAAIGITCGMVGDVTLKFPPLAPLEVRTVNVKLPAANTTGSHEFWAIMDSECTMGASPSYNIDPYTVVEEPAAEVVLKDYAPYGTPYYEGPLFRDLQTTEPGILVEGQPFKATIVASNMGKVTAEAGYRVLAHTYNSWVPLPCASFPNISAAELPRLAPKKDLQITLDNLIAGNNDTYTWVHFCVVPPSGQVGTTSMSTAFMLGPSSNRPTARIMADGPSKTTLFNAITASPKRPKAGKTMTVKVKVTNRGSIEGPARTGGLYLAPFNGHDQYDYGIIYFYAINGGYGSRCSRGGMAATFTANFTSVLQPGQSKTLSFKNVPVPATPRSYAVAVEFDLDCQIPWEFHSSVNFRNQINVITVV